MILVAETGRGGEKVTVLLDFGVFFLSFFPFVSPMQTTWLGMGKEDGPNSTTNIATARQRQRNTGRNETNGGGGAGGRSSSGPWL